MTETKTAFVKTESLNEPGEPEVLKHTAWSRIQYANGDVKSVPEGNKVSLTALKARLQADIVYIDSLIAAIETVEDNNA